MREVRGRQAQIGWPNLQRLKSCGRRAIIWAALLLPVLFLCGCAGLVSGKNSQAVPAPNPQNYTISGTITPAAGGSGATVALSGTASGTTTANASGAFTFSGLANGTYTITPSHAGYTFSPSSASVTINGADVTSGVSFTATAQGGQTYSISGTISPTAGGSGATVTLSGAAAASTTADSAGNYTFSGLANGTYAVTPSLSGYAYTPTSQSAIVNGANVTGVNFAAQSSPTFSISGTISPTLGGSAATVTLTGTAAATTTTNGAGSYTFTGLPNGNYTVTPTNTGFSFTPVNQSVTVSSANVPGVNFSATAEVPHSVALTWTASTSTVAGYNVYRLTGTGTVYTRINTSLITALTYTDTTVQNATTYSYVATAVDSSGNESVYSSPVSAAIP